MVLCVRFTVATPTECRAPSRVSRAARRLWGGTRCRASRQWCKKSDQLGALAPVRVGASLEDCSTASRLLGEGLNWDMMMEEDEATRSTRSSSSQQKEAEQVTRTIKENI